MPHRLAVIVATPAHSTVVGPLSYLSELPLAPGTLVRVPLGRREVLGVVWDADPAAAPPPADLAEKPIAGVLEGVAPLPAAWRRLVGFAAGYYQRSPGEVALAALPVQLRGLNAVQLARRLKRVAPDLPATAQAAGAPALTQQQQQALAQLQAGPGPFLLHGATGSGKTEVYLRAVQDLLERDPGAQALVLVPEINLTPQLQSLFVARFGAEQVVALHSGLTHPQRLRHWLAAHAGAARIVLGTRMGVFASLPRLRLIVVDEEHDPSYKQQEGARYSARDLAVYRGRLEGATVVLGSATPSLESWQAGERGRYRRLAMPERIGAGALPRVRVVDMNHQPKKAVLSPPLLEAMAERIARGEQSMLFLNRRGYAPVLACTACDWKSDCPHCSAYRVFHKIDRTLRCHHCGFTERVPRACPLCGNLDIAPLGRGTERLEEHLGELLAGVRRPDGGAVRIVRIDADTTRHKGTLEAQLAQVHGGEVDVLVGTQMVTKGHDFRRITLVAALNPDSALFSADFRAPERLFALLMQAAGRAGRDAAQAAASEMWVQTWHPAHPLFAALRRHDFAAFAAQQLQEREQAGMPPFAYQALLRAEARTQEAAQAFLNAAREAAPGLEGAEHVVLYSAVPMAVQRVANVERAQLLAESTSRAALQRFLSAWQPVLLSLREKGLIRWAVDVDPLAV
ncbi:primosomal protein N' [Ramlibacter tataouinensis]|uniref:Replication restart protein PriA n=1 Tax=Ramlibacter tataouinensis (strain ATCC BAA-407 / DSM 14655 / LMG 21543 / TTB310) TaxID=365046 RepID=F5XVJ9_RAMTT|nr:primosomal protein N' [Ramlibacter tataouinensis]AEG91575.1 Candidate primosomal protein N [Ramlibacter tataouinensis TTB310]